MNTTIHSGLAPYQGTWGDAELIHLLRRTLFGVTKADINAFSGMTLTQVVDSLLNYSTMPPYPPINNYNSTTLIDPDVPLGQTWVNAPYLSAYDFSRRKSLWAWWIQQMVNQDRNIREKMTLFWQNHFVTNYTDVKMARASYLTNTLLRSSSLGNFKQLTKAITKDVGMLRYLNGILNSKISPNENYARELQELFTLGIGSGYTENDVKAAAKVLTGYAVDVPNMAYYFDPSRHDYLDKQFSAFYNNTLITGLTGAAGEDEVDALLDMIFAKNQVALFMCRNIYRFFVYYKITPSIETNVIIPLAETFRNNNYEILPVMAQLLKSEHFFDNAVRGCLIKSPVDFVIGACRQMYTVFPDSTDLALQVRHYHYLDLALIRLQQSPTEPPTVAGWQAYYQAPAYHEMWLNSVTYPERIKFVNQLLTTGYPYGSHTLIFDIIHFTQDLDNPSDPNLLVAEAVMLLYGLDVSQTIKDYMKSILLSGQSSDIYWTIAWDNYIQNPSDHTLHQEVYTRLMALYVYLLSSPEYQLS